MNKTIKQLITIGAIGTTLIFSVTIFFTSNQISAAQSGPFSFGEAIPIAEDQEIASLAVGDFNRDGNEDVAAFSGEFRSGVPELMHWFSGPEMTQRVLNSAFYPDSMAQFPGAAESADIDKDGDLDLVFGNAAHGGGGSGDIIWLENLAEVSETTGDWTVHTVQAFENNAGHMNDIAIADIDRDGKLDVVMRHLGSAETLRILFQEDARADRWTLRSIGDLPFREGMGTADLDRDGDPDILLNGYWLETPENPRTEPFVTHTLDSFYTSQEQSGLNNSTKQAFGDINGDGRTDVVLTTAEGDSGWLAWYAQPENPRTDEWPRTRLIETTRMHTLQLADFDLDGDLDILTGFALGSSGVSIWENQNKGTIFLEHEILTDRPAYTGRPFDADGDGDLDIVAQEQCCNGGGDLYWIENLVREPDSGNPGTIPTRTPAPEQPSPEPTQTPIPTEEPSTPVIGSGDVNISGFAYTPQGIKVATGTTITWVNQDAAAHTVTGTNWGSGTLDQNESYSYIFEQPGTYSYFCSIHPTMQGLVTVENSTIGSWFNFLPLIVNPFAIE
ncbi:MAG: FG-GAP-like repeat-containing protein [Chloroflexota bacterium]